MMTVTHVINKDNSSSGVAMNIRGYEQEKGCRGSFSTIGNIT